MKKTVRIGTVADHERFRIEDCRKMTPNERVMIVFDLQRRFFQLDRYPLTRVVSVRYLYGKTQTSK